MFEKSEIEVLKSQLPANYSKPVTEKTGLSSATINRFFNFQKIRRNNAEAIYDACLEIIQEYKDRTASRKRKIQKLMVGDGEQKSLEL